MCGNTGKTMKTREVKITEYYCEECETWERNVVACESCGEKQCSYCGEFYPISDDLIYLCGNCYKGYSENKEI